MTSAAAVAVALVAEVSRDEEADYDLVRALLASSPDLGLTATVLAGLCREIGREDEEHAVAVVRAVALHEARRRAGVPEEEDL